MQDTIIFGLGSPHGDDQFGWLVADRLADEMSRRGMPAAGVRRVGSPVQVLDWLDGCERLFLVDACRGDLPGEFCSFDWPAAEIERLRCSGSHDYTIWQALELASRLGQLPRECRLWCAAGSHFAAGQPISPRLLAVVPKLADDVFQALVS